jgi:hypothetical protein
MTDRKRLLFARIDVTDGSSDTVMGVPKRADEREESSTTTRERLGKVDVGRGRGCRDGEDDSGGDAEVDEGVFDDVEVLRVELLILVVLLLLEVFLSARRKGDRVKVGRRRKVDEPGIEGRVRPDKR